MTQQEILSMCEREFSPEVTMKQILSSSKEVHSFIKWGVERSISVITNEHDECVGMVMKFNDERFDEFVFITLSWDDTYRIRFVSEDFEIYKDVPFVFCDQLFNVIDNSMNSVMKMVFSMN
jgi:hypothetical protein